MALPRQLGRVGVAEALVLLAFAGLVRADNPTEQAPPARNASRANPSDSTATPANSGSAVPPPPPAQPNDAWSKLLAQHYAYRQAIDNLTPLPTYDPRDGAPFHLFADGGFWMVHSFLGTNPIFRFGPRQSSASGAAPLLDAHNFDYSVDFGPQLTVGAVGAGGLGFRTSWCRLDESATSCLTGNTGVTPIATVSSVPVFGVPGFTFPGPVAQQLRLFNDGFVFNNHVHLDVWDWEAFQDFRGERWSLLLSGGARYGYQSQGYRAFRSNSGSTRSGTTRITLRDDSDVVESGRNFGGIGPTAALAVRRAVLGTSMSLYASARGSVLFGHEKTRSFQRTMQLQQAVTGSGPPRTSSSNVTLQASTGEGETIPMGDFEAGAEWRVELGRWLLFSRAGVVDQTWFGSGSATSDRGETSFFGLRFTVGVNY